MSSSQIYYTYYSPTDIQHPNKVQYTDNLSAAGDILVTSIKGFNNLNERKILTSSWGDGIQKQNDFNYNVSITNGFKFNYAFTKNIQYLSSNPTVANTVARQITIDDFDYDTIFGLTRANPAVIDYNWYNAGGSNNIFGGTRAVTDKETTRIGPKLFLYEGVSNNYTTGTITKTLNGNTTTVSNLTTNSSTSTFNYISNYIGKKLEWNGSSTTIQSNTKLQDAEESWPYKVQYKNDQWYHILTNGQKSALLTLPYWYADSTDLNTERFYILSTKSNSNGIQTFNYYKLDKIVENNYYYITSYFDTRPTVKKEHFFGSNCSSLFNENTIQVLPLTKYTYNTFYAMHEDNLSSCVASCVPVSYTTSKKPAVPLLVGSTYDSIKYSENFGLNPIAIKYDKNITITTTVNYTIANMTNLANILTGWDYLHKDFTNDEDVNNHPLISRGNLPYINAGIIIYVPTTASNTVKSSNLNNGNALVRFVNWLNSFGCGQFYSGITTSAETHIVDSSTINFGSYFKSTYKYIYDTSDYTNVGEFPENGVSNTSNFYNLSTPAFINFNTTVGWNHGDNLNPDAPDEYFFLSKDGSCIRLVNTLCAPINNALNTTHTATDNYTFRLNKLGSYTEQFYIIGTYVYITKGLNYNTSAKYPHYLGFSPSTNITTHNLMTEAKGTTEWNHYLYPNKAMKIMLWDTSNLDTIFDGVNPYTNVKPENQNALMKDIFITPSLYMTLNESVGDV